MIRVYTAVNKVTILSVADTLECGDVLPDFTVKVGEVFVVLG